MGLAETYSRIIFSVSTFSGFPKFFLSVKISPTRLDNIFLPALKFINPPITVYSLSSLSIYSKIEFAICGGAILANLAKEDTLTA